MFYLHFFSSILCNTQTYFEISDKSPNFPLTISANVAINDEKTRRDLSFDQEHRDIPHDRSKRRHTVTGHSHRSQCHGSQRGMGMTKQQVDDFVLRRGPCK